MNDQAFIRWILAASLLTTACATGRVREVQASGLGRFEASQLALEPDSAAHPAAEAFLNGVSQASALPAASISESSFRLRLRAVEGSAYPLEFVGELYSPDGGSRAGFVRWRGRIAPKQAGQEAGLALGRQMQRHRFDRVARRAGDDRIFFVPTGQTADKGSFFVTDDEVLLLRFGGGLSRRVQLAGWFGGLPIPAAGATPVILDGLLGGVAGAGIGVVGVADLGVKVRLLEESRLLPAVAVSYDLLDLFGAAVGVGAGGVAGRGGGVGAGAIAGGVANAQFNLFSLAASKHLGAAEIVLGSYLLDNHHFLPQSARFGAVAASPQSDGVETGSTTDGTTLEHLPLQVQPFLALQYVLGEHSALATEFFPRLPFRESLASFGARWVLGGNKPLGPLALDRVRFRIDLAGLGFYSPGRAADPETGTEETKPGFGLLPWLGLGVYVL